MSELLSRIERELAQRRDELAPLVEEHSRLQAAIEALGTRPLRDGIAQDVRRSRQRSVRAPRGATKARVFAVIEERPGVSAGEIAAVAGLKTALVHTTLSRARKAGEIEDTDYGVKLKKETGNGGGETRQPVESSLA